MGILFLGTATVPTHWRARDHILTSSVKMLTETLYVFVPLSFKSFFSPGRPREHDRPFPCSLTEVFFPTSKSYAPCFITAWYKMPYKDLLCIPTGMRAILCTNLKAFWSLYKYIVFSIFSLSENYPLQIFWDKKGDFFSQFILSHSRRFTRISKLQTYLEKGKLIFVQGMNWHHLYHLLPQAPHTHTLKLSSIYNRQLGLNQVPLFPHDLRLESI